MGEKEEGPEQVGPQGRWTLWRNKRSGEGMDSILRHLRAQEAPEDLRVPGEAANDADPTSPTR